MEIEMESKAYVDGYIERARKAQREYEKFSQEQIDEIVMTVAKVVHDNAEYLAETRIGFDRKADEERGFYVSPDGVTVVPKGAIL